MSDCSNEMVGDVGMTNVGLTFDNLVILREFGNIANLVREQGFLETVPKAKLRRVKWIPMFTCLKQGILDDMVQEFNAMWEYENLSEKVESLEKQKERFEEINADQTVWRPQLGNVKAQLKAHDVANLKKQKKHLETLAREYDNRVNRQKKIIIAKRGYLKALQQDIIKYQKKGQECMDKINMKLHNHTELIDEFTNKINMEDMSRYQYDTGNDSED